jgi:hypothetical protein
MHHNDAPNLDPRTDITDLYIFQNPGDSTKSILILNVNPEAPTHANAFDHQASYEFKIDTNGDFEAEIAFHVLFKSIDEEQQTATLYRATDVAAQGAGPIGEIIIQDAPVSFTQEARITTAGGYRFYAGLRSEPFFADPTGFFNNLQWSGQDFWAGKNVFSIVLDVPNNSLGPRPEIGIWGRTMAMVEGVLSSVNKCFPETTLCGREPTPIQPHQHNRGNSSFLNTWQCSKHSVTQKHKQPVSQWNGYRTFFHTII